jgi:colanic acid biosynthesis glycosyl transferase WcaI
MSAPHRILILSLCYWPEKAGGAPPVQQMAEALAQGDAQVSVLTTRPSYPEMAVFPAYRDGSRDWETHQGVTIQRLAVPPQPADRKILSVLKTEGLFAFKAWWSLLRQPRPDVAVAVSPSILAVLAMRLAVSRRARRIAVVHDIQSGLAKSLKITRLGIVTRVLAWLERRALGGLDELITLSPAMADVIRKLGVMTPISIVPPTVDDERIRPQPEPDGPMRLLYSGNIGRKQGLEQLLDLAEELQQRRANCEMIIRGDGNYRATLQQLAAQRQLQNLTFAPFTPIERLSDGLAEGQIHLVPQNPAGAAFAAPSKVYSIMAAGRPFVCTAEPGSPLDKLRDECDAFVICPPNQPDQFADAVERLIADPTERARLGRNGRAYVEQHAGRTAAARAYHDLVSDPRSLAKAACRDTA